MTDLLRRAEKYVNAEEGLATRKQKTSWSDQQEKEEHSISVPRKKQKRKWGPELTKDDLRHKFPKREESPKKGTPIPNYNNFAPLLETRTRILVVEKDRVPIQWPAPLRSPADKSDSNKYCRYHRDHVHDTEECRHLKNQIEDLIRKGHLRKYVEEMLPREEGSIEKKLHSMIHTISGGVASRGDHNRARKAYARQTIFVQIQHTHAKRLKIGREEEVISFSKANLEGVHLPPDDPVVVTLQVELFTMKRILLDSGSSAAILYKPEFDQLRIPEDQLKSVKTPLVGFADEIVHPLRSIDLSVITGTTLCQTNV
ncbi:hypothetical protein CFOL_v3_25651 [Cephalotus follicularis]|uniref:Uncharacterized protein n=1 Tax=Cephalotus follicularis TaxID=3775 RepID=A0A1Q3CPM1_CEPFO|nr:hypothetical protein CFOL_v3_25651 [Cephalotus follicularis]